MSYYAKVSLSFDRSQAALGQTIRQDLSHEEPNHLNLSREFFPVLAIIPSLIAQSSYEESLSWTHPSLSKIQFEADGSKS
mmetsp:Transcript_5733/g.8064  ORF Transcript_5733/g.8064 Transcript_5733/m.8064 type:complete len:80 (-) Transcript_5733:1290-1529(-)